MVLLSRIIKNHRILRKVKSSMTQPSPILQPLRTLTGILLILLGILSLMLPILPGWLLIFAGILLAFPESGKAIVERIKTWKEDWRAKIAKRKS